MCRNLNPSEKSSETKWQIYIVENVLQGAKDSGLTRLFDLFLLNVFGGKERSLQDYKELLKNAGLKFSGLIETSSSMSIIVVNN